MYLQAQGIDDKYVGGGRVRRARGRSDNNGGVGRGIGIRDASKGLETTTEALEEEDDHEDYNNDNRCVCRG